MGKINYTKAAKVAGATTVAVAASTMVGLAGQEYGEKMFDKTVEIVKSIDNKINAVEVKQKKGWFRTETVTINKRTGERIK